MRLPLRPQPAVNLSLSRRAYSARRIWLAPAYLLHQRAYRDTSRILEVFSREQGRLTLFARGANGSKSRIKAVLRPFQRLLVSWSGNGEACQLVGAEIDGAATALPNQRLMSGFYLNELLLKLTQRCDPHPEIFDAYAICLEALCSDDGEEENLRRFEKRMLDKLGYGLELSRTAAGEPVSIDAYYQLQAQRGPEPCVADAPGAIYGGSLAALSAEAFADSRSLKDAKRVLRAAIDACLDGRALRSREVMLSMRRRAP